MVSIISSIYELILENLFPIKLITSGLFTISTNHNQSNQTEIGLRKYSLITNIFLSFSLINNTRSMFINKPNKFGSIDLIRFLMLINVIIMHQYYVSIGWSTLPLAKNILNGLMLKAGTENRYGFLRNIHTTDFFFALTGLLLAYSTLRSLEKNNGRFNYCQYIINIYLRFYPTVFGTILIYYLLPLFSQGPFWHLLDQYYVESCRQQLFSSLFTYNFYTSNLEHFAQHSMV